MGALPPTPRPEGLNVSESPTKPLFEKSHRPYLLRKLHSLSGVVPVGAFMCFHLW